mmetsp:Transcript_8194/g.34422  ORF Transcript_8194/g.34422 Transcript_8194/m.34422 type:complete len:204 (+) Transcript_8194:227-838(+)
MPQEHVQPKGVQDLRRPPRVPHGGGAALVPAKPQRTRVLRCSPAHRRSRDHRAAVQVRADCAAVELEQERGELLAVVRRAEGRGRGGGGGQGDPGVPRVLRLAGSAALPEAPAEERTGGGVQGSAGVERRAVRRPPPHVALRVHCREGRLREGRRHPPPGVRGKPLRRTHPGLHLQARLAPHCARARRPHPRHARGPPDVHRR